MRDNEDTRYVRRAERKLGRERNSTDREKKRKKKKIELPGKQDGIRVRVGGTSGNSAGHLSLGKTWGAIQKKNTVSNGGGLRGGMGKCRYTPPFGV